MGLFTQEIELIPIAWDFTNRREISPKQKVRVNVLMADGESMDGEMYFRPMVSCFLDGLNQNEEIFIAMTRVADPKNESDNHTFLLNSNHIVAVAVAADVEGALSTTPRKDTLLTSRKVQATIRTIGGGRYTGSLYVRNTIHRTKDELNLRDSQFIALTDVVDSDRQLSDQTYFINKNHIVLASVANDQIQE